MILKCDFCGKEFEREDKRVRYSLKVGQTKFFCSSMCQKNKYDTRQLISCMCGRKFKKRAGEIRKSDSGLSFCSRSCSASHFNSTRTDYDDRSVTKACLLCGKDFASSKYGMSSYCKNCVKPQAKAAKNTRFSIPVERVCTKCSTPFSSTHGSNSKICATCRRNILSEIGRRSGISRSKNEIYFAELCSLKFARVETNVRIFNGWDADVIIHDLKIAVLWNGAWHHKKIKKNHSVRQVQNRDQIKCKEIVKAGYTPYIIDDYGGEDRKLVESKFSEFEEWTLNLSQP